MSLDDAGARRDDDPAVGVGSPGRRPGRGAGHGDLRSGVASMPKGMWRRDVEGGLTANAFVPDTLNDLVADAS